GRSRERPQSFSWRNDINDIVERQAVEISHREGRSGHIRRVQSGYCAALPARHRLEPMKALRAFCPILLTLGLTALLQPLQGFAREGSDAPKASPAERDGHHDFDFEIGTWK